MFFLIIVTVKIRSTFTDMTIPMIRPIRSKKAKTDIAAAIPIIKTAQKQNADIFCVANRL